MGYHNPEWFCHHGKLWTRNCDACDTERDELLREEGRKEMRALVSGHEHDMREALKWLGDSDMPWETRLTGATEWLNGALARSAARTGDGEG